MASLRHPQVAPCGAAVDQLFLYKTPMNANMTLSDNHLQTYNRLFQHPTLYNIGWREVTAMLRDLCHVEEKPNGSLRFTRRGQTLVLRTHLTKEVSDISELNALRDFLLITESEQPGKGEATTHWVLVIDHHQARVFNSDLQGTQALQIQPPQTTDHFRHTADSIDFSHSWEPHGQNAFFATVAQSLKIAENVLVLGTGTGTSSCMHQFVGWVKSHHPDLAGRILGTLTVNEHHMSDDQLLGVARNFFSKQHVA